MGSESVLGLSKNDSARQKKEGEDFCYAVSARTDCEILISISTVRLFEIEDLWEAVDSGNRTIMVKLRRLARFDQFRDS